MPRCGSRSRRAERTALSFFCSQSAAAKRDVGSACLLYRLGLVSSFPLGLLIQLLSSCCCWSKLGAWGMVEAEGHPLKGDSDCRQGDGPLPLLCLWWKQVHCGSDSRASSRSSVCCGTQVGYCDPRSRRDSTNAGQHPAFALPHCLGYAES